MVFGLIGENCTGKSTLAEAIRNMTGAEVITGKDYLRLAKSESEAKALFKSRLQDAATGAHIIYVISEKEQMDLLPRDAVRIVVTADLADIKERFRQRMHGNLPKPVEQMLERKHGMFDNTDCDIRFDSTHDNIHAVMEKISAMLEVRPF